MISIAALKPENLVFKPVCHHFFTIVPAAGGKFYGFKLWNTLENRDFQRVLDIKSPKISRNLGENRDSHFLSTTFYIKKYPTFTISSCDFYIRISKNPGGKFARGRQNIFQLQMPLDIDIVPTTVESPCSPSGLLMQHRKYEGETLPAFLRAAFVEMGIKVKGTIILWNSLGSREDLGFSKILSGVGGVL